MGVKMGWIQIKMGHPLARNGATLAPFRANGAHPSYACLFSLPFLYYYYPARACASKGLCDRSWCLYIISLDFFLEPIFYLPKYSLSEVYFNTDRLLIEFNGL